VVLLPDFAFCGSSSHVIFLTLIRCINRPLRRRSRLQCRHRFTADLNRRHRSQLLYCPWPQPLFQLNLQSRHPKWRSQENPRIFHLIRVCCHITARSFGTWLRRCCKVSCESIFSAFSVAVADFFFLMSEF
jgi:hypothetical protein